MMRSSRLLARTVAAATLALVAGGCAAVRPVELHPSLPAPSRFVSEYRPPPPQAEESTAAPRTLVGPPAEEGEEGETRATEGDATRSRAWWTAFADPALDAAIQEALRNNYFIRDLRNLVYENALEPAMPRGPLWPLQIGVPASVQHTVAAAPPALSSPGYGLTYDSASAGISASYQIDVWGQLDVSRRLFEDLVEQQRYSTEAFGQVLADQISQCWFEILEQRALRGLLDRQVHYNEDLLGIVKARFEQHLVTHLAVLQQEQLLLAMKAQAPLIVAQMALLNAKLTSLLGRTPNPNANLVPEDRRLPDLPPEPAVGTPSDLMRNTPELRQAQYRVAEAEHLVSQNLASWLPTIEAFGDAGVKAFGPGPPGPLMGLNQVFPTADAGIRLTWPIFDGGQRVTRAKQLELTVQRRTWQYQLAFNNAMQRVQDALIQEQKQTENVRTLRTQVALGRDVLREARQLFEQGLSDYLPVLTALTSLSNLERAAIQAQRLLLSYRVQLYHALGGTWSAAATQLPK
jgi:multidrug efflux system outer membrane protein